MEGHECGTAAPAIREIMGCDGPKTGSTHLEFQGAVIDRCPAYYRRMAGDMSFAFEVYSWREKGFLPYPGNWLDQPNKIVEICNFMEQLVAEKMRLMKKDE